MNPAVGCGISGGRPEVIFEPVTAGVRPSVDALLIERITTPFGSCLTATADGAVCFLEFIAGNDQPVLDRLEAIWPGVRLTPATRPGPPLGPLLGANGSGTVGQGPAALHLRGTTFQLRVWEALLDIPAGTRVAYGELAVRVGMPRAARTVAAAVAANHLAVLVPCHRVVRANGDAGGYRWGRPLKLALLAAEQAAPHPTVTHGVVIQPPRR
jgi:AraC family transcriptional regulator of adaptative response/methylated-DNA-[protein]-cysteine methyltransferase